VRAGIAIEPLESAPLEAWSAALAGSDWIVDALLGTGAAGAPRGGIAAAIEAINRTRAADARVDRRPSVFAVDIPSGLDCDTGLAAGDCVRADATATFPTSSRLFSHLQGFGTRLMQRAEELAAGDAAEQQRALHLVDFVVYGGGPEVADAHRRKAELLDLRADSERSFVAHNVLKSAAVLERQQADDAG
jgi:hypothetical protein